MKYKFCVLTLLSVLLLTSGFGQDSSWLKTTGGLPYRYFTGNGQKTLHEEAIVKIHVRQSLNDSIMFDSWKNQIPVYLPARSNGQTYDVNELFLLPLRDGDSIVAVQLLDSFIKRNPELTNRFKPTDQILTYIRVLDIFETPSEAQADEKKEKSVFLSVEISELEAYLKANKINAVKKGSGVFIRQLKKGTGTAPALKDADVSVAYKGTTLDGKLFDSNIDAAGKVTSPLRFFIGQGQMIAGFDEGVAGLRKGDKVVLYIPSMLAYGTQPPSPEIPLNAALIFEVEVLSVKNPVIKKPSVQAKPTVKKPVQKTPTKPATKTVPLKKS